MSDDTRTETEPLAWGYTHAEVRRAIAKAARLDEVVAICEDEIKHLGSPPFDYQVNARDTLNRILKKAKGGTDVR